MIATADLRAWLGNPPGPGVTTLLEALEARAVEIVEEHCERYFGTPATHTEYLIGSDSPILQLNEQPSAITSVDYRNYVGESWAAITEGNDDGFELRAPKREVISAKSQLLRKSGYLWANGVEYRVIYDFGYTAGAEPAAIRQAILDLVSFYYQQRGLEGLKSFTAADVSKTVLDFQGARGLLGSIPGLLDTFQAWRGRMLV